MSRHPCAAILGCEGPVLTTAERDFFRAVRPFGFILFARNIENPDQLRKLTTDLREAVSEDVPIAIDQEGGRVQRMRPPHWRDWPAPLDQIERVGSVQAGHSMYLRMRLIAAELAAVGIDMNCAPVGDLATDQTHPFLRNRCYGTEVEPVIGITRNVAYGLLDGGTLPVLKHIPGHGRAVVDSHLEPPFVDAPRAVLDDTDFRVFRAVADLPVGMTGHMIFDAIDPATPSTASAAVLGIVRDAIGFDGLLMTDDLSMEALSGTVAQRTAAALAAGCDLALHCNGALAEMQAVVEAAGPMSDMARERGAKALALRIAAPDIDIPALEAEFDSLMR